MKNTIIFDVDGTLLDTERAQLKALRQVLVQHGQQYTLDDLRVIFGIPGKVALKRLGVKDVDAAYIEWGKAIDAYLDEMALFYGIIDVLKALKAKGKKLGIVTAKTRQQLQYEFTPFGINKYFDVMITADDTDQPKPDPSPLHLCIERLGTTIKDVLYIGDSIYDYECARDAHVMFALASWGARDIEGIDTPYVLSEALDILNIV